MLILYILDYTSGNFRSDSNPKPKFDNLDMASHFTVLKTDPTGARLGRLVTAHGVVETPAFMPVGTQGTVKAMLPRDLKGRWAARFCSAIPITSISARGAERIRELGGLHRFMSWDGPILTDSGGYQVFSLGAMRKLSEEGGAFNLIWTALIISLPRERRSDSRGPRQRYRDGAGRMYPPRREP